jgi:hypothetical protein
MSSIRLHHLIFRDKLLLLVFYEPAHCYQFRLINRSGEVLGQPSIFYTAEAAERAGREALAWAA